MVIAQGSLCLIFILELISSPSNAEQWGRCGRKKCTERNGILNQTWFNSSPNRQLPQPKVSTGSPGRARSQRTRALAALGLSGDFLMMA